MKVFLSHNKKDSNLAHKIATDLKSNNISVWFDEWEIFVGDSIVQKVQEGLKSCDFLSIIFTKNSEGSNWIEREWQSILHKELENRNIIILPIKGDDCEIPFILRDKLYADFSSDYNFAINQLIDSINHHGKNNANHIKEKIDDDEDNPNEIEIKFNNLDFDTFSNKDKEKVARAISEMLGLSDIIKITNVRRGSVIIRIKFPNEQLIGEFFKKMDKLNIKEAELEDAWLYVDNKQVVKTFTINEIISIEGSSISPSVYINSIIGHGFMKGRVIPERPSDFFDPIINWIKNNLLSSSLKSFEFDFNLEYCNSGSSKYILVMLRLFRELYKNGVKTTINWYFEEDDEANLSLGKHIRNTVNVPFKLISFEE
jgi:hypothetical protein